MEDRKIEKPDIEKSIDNNDGEEKTVIMSRLYRHPNYIRDFIEPLHTEVSQSTPLLQELVSLVVSYLSRQEIDLPADLSDEQIKKTLSLYRDAEFVYRLSPDLPRHRVHEICELIKSNISSSTSPIFHNNVNRENKEDVERIRLLYNGIKKIGFFSRAKAKFREKKESLSHAFHVSPAGRQNNGIIPFFKLSNGFLLLLTLFVFLHARNIKTGDFIFTAAMFVMMNLLFCVLMRENISRVWREGAQDYNNQQLENTPLLRRQADNKRPANNADVVALDVIQEGFYDPKDRKGFRRL